MSHLSEVRLQERQALVQQWAASGLCRKDFARLTGVPASSLCGWVRRASQVMRASQAERQADLNMRHAKRFRERFPDGDENMRRWYCKVHGLSQAAMAEKLQQMESSK